MVPSCAKIRLQANLGTTTSIAPLLLFITKLMKHFLPESAAFEERDNGCCEALVVLSIIPRLLERPRVWLSADFDPSGFEARSEKNKIKTCADRWQREREVRELRFNSSDPWYKSSSTHQLAEFVPGSQWFNSTTALSF